MTQKDHLISASQINTYEDCNRFWWFQRILKLSEAPQAHFTFGTVLHAVCERYLSADMQGRVPMPENIDDCEDGGADGIYVLAGPLKGQVVGQPVNLYPDGWETTTERDGSTASVTPNEAKLIQRLITEAIEEGILVRSEGVQVERKLIVPVIEGTSLIGYVDAYRPADGIHALPVIEDHKSFGKGSIPYLQNDKPKTKNYLGKNQQVLTYAWGTSELDGWEGDVSARHNQFPKFPGRKVTDVGVPIPRAEIVKHGDYVRDVATRMSRTRNIKKWEDVPGPKDTGKCSRWYGRSCPMSGICGRTETAEAYKQRIENLTAKGPAIRLNLPIPKPKPRRKAKGASDMSIFDQAKKKKAAAASRQAKAGTTKAKSKAKAKPAEPEVSINGSEPEAVAVVANGAPWANENCKACKGRGLTSKNKACPICDNTAKRAGKLTSMAYVVVVTDEGTVIASAREEHAEALDEAGMMLDWDEADASLATTSTDEDGTEYGDAEGEATEPAEKPATGRKAKPARATSAQKAKAQAPEEAPAEVPAAEAMEQVQEALPTSTPEKGKRATKSKAGRKNVGLTIMVGSFFIRGVPGGRTMITSAEVLARFGAELAEDMGAESYWELDSFKRRDRLAQKADYIVGELNRHILVHPGTLGNDDTGSLVRALMGCAEGIDAVSVGIS